LPDLSAEINESLDALRYMLRDRGWPLFVRSLELFTNGSQTMVNVLETEGGRGVAKGFFEWLGKHIGGCGAGRARLRGPPARPTMSAMAAFFQVNRFLVDALAEKAVAGAEGRVALDLYSGVGLFAVRLARQFAVVAAVESNHQAARDLALNAEHAGVQVEIHSMQAEQYLGSLKTAPDFVLADPPRSGLGQAGGRTSDPSAAAADSRGELRSGDIGARRGGADRGRLPAGEVERSGPVPADLPHREHRRLPAGIGGRNAPGGRGGRNSATALSNVTC